MMVLWPRYGFVLAVVRSAIVRRPVGKVERKFAMSMFLAARPLLKPGLMGVLFRKTFGLIGSHKAKAHSENPSGYA